MKPWCACTKDIQYVVYICASDVIYSYMIVGSCCMSYARMLPVPIQCMLIRNSLEAPALYLLIVN